MKALWTFPSLEPRECTIIERIDPDPEDGPLTIGVKAAFDFICVFPEHDGLTFYAKADELILWLFECGDHGVNEPTCDYCGKGECFTPELEWNGETGCHVECER